MNSSQTMYAAGMEIDVEAASKYKQLTASESIRNTHMFLGSHVTEAIKSHVLDPGKTKFELVELQYPPSILQVFMEQIANVIDQMNSCPVETTQFRFSFNEISGQASVMNNGKSIPVTIVPNAAGQPQWLPEMLCSGMFTSSNHKKSEGVQRTTLGAHGIGLKGMTSVSSHMRVECVDLERGKYYCQDIYDCNKKVMPPLITEINKKNKPPVEMKTGGTRFTYTLDYEFYKSQPGGLPADILKTMNRLFEARTYQIAGYTGRDTWYNDTKLAVKNRKGLTMMYFENVQYFELKHLDHPEWPLGVGFAGVSSDRDPEHISIINGGYITKGVHFKHIVDQITQDLSKRITTSQSAKSANWTPILVRNFIKKNLNIVIIGTLPDLIFDKQTKTDLNMKDHASYFKKFEWPKNYSDKAWSIIKEALDEKFVGGSTKKTSKKLNNPNKYTKAGNLGGPDSDLLGFEGDSAQSAAILAFGEDLPHFDQKNIGIILLGGCPMNVQKYMVDTKINGVVHSRPGQKILDNVVWNDFMTIMNLKYDTKYDTPAALKTLNYKHYTNVTDKDLHGMGKIGAIMISNILMFWPELLSVPGFLGYFDSTLIRAFPKGSKNTKVKSFGSQSEYDLWASSFPDGVPPKSEWEMKWYKGMATHSKEECISMFKNYDKLRIAYTDDQKDALIRMAGYFGKNVDLRKDLLRLPLVPIPDRPGRRGMEIGDYCDYYVREEQQYNLICKLNGAIDGFINTHRKIAWGAIGYKNSHDRNSAIKVYQLGGDIAKRCYYHHGNDSICNAITWMAQDFVGARNIPHLLPLSNGFGTRFFQDDEAAPRYIDTQCNPIVDAIYPPADRELYEMLIEDGVETTPKYLVPVVCMPILETNSLPATGWAISKLARDFDDHVENIFRLLDGHAAIKMRPWTPGWKGEVIEIGNSEWTIGKCSWNPVNNVVTISELPYQVKIKPYIEGTKAAAKAAEKREKDPANKESKDKKKIICLKSLEYVMADTVVDRSSPTQVCIQFQLMPGAMDYINDHYGTADIDPLTDYLGLKESFPRGLNFINTDNTVISFSTYEEAMIPWFKERCRLYPLRFERRCILIDLEVEMLRNQIRYIGERGTLGVSGKPKSQQIQIVESAGFKKFNLARLKSPGVPNPKIASVVHGSEASFMYLLNISDLDASEESVAKLHEKIENLLTERAVLNEPGIMRRVWSEEIAEVGRQIKNGHTNGWVPKGKYVYD